MKKNKDSPSEAGPALRQEAETSEDWSRLDAIAGTMSDDFTIGGREQPALQERPALDEIF